MKKQTGNSGHIGHNRRPSSLLNVQELATLKIHRNHPQNFEPMSVTMRTGNDSPSFSRHHGKGVNPTSIITSRINLIQSEVSDFTFQMKTLKDDI